MFLQIKKKLYLIFKMICLKHLVVLALGPTYIHLLMKEHILSLADIHDLAFCQGSNPQFTKRTGAFSQQDYQFLLHNITKRNNSQNYFQKEYEMSEIKKINKLSKAQTQLDDILKFLSACSKLLLSHLINCPVNINSRNVRDISKCVIYAVTKIYSDTLSQII